MSTPDEFVDKPINVQRPNEHEPAKKLTFFSRAFSIKVAFLFFLLIVSFSMVQAQDADGDGVLDSLDYCINAGGVVNALGCPFPAVCDTIETATISFDTSGLNAVAGYVTIYVLADSVGVIVDTSSAPQFINVMAGKYMVTALDYDDDASLANFAIGDTINDVTANCFEWSDALTYRICPAEICNNGIDDDEDGLTDCADSDCASYYALVVSSESNVINSTNSLGVADGATADLESDIGEIILDLGTVVQQGTDITLMLKYHVNSGGSIPVADIDGSINPGGPFTDLITVNTLTLSVASYTYTVNEVGGIQYLRIQSRSLGGNPTNQFIDIDGISYCGDATCITAPIVTPGSNSPICEGGDLNLTETGGDAVNWTWSGPNSFTSSDQNPTISGAATTAAGKYYVTITDASSCTNIDSVTVVVNALPLVSLTLPDTEECLSTPTMTLSGGSPGGGTYSGTGVTGTTFNLSEAGVGVHTITYTYIDGNSCTNTATDNITIYELPTISLTSVVGPSTSGGNDGSIDITVTGGSGSYTYVWGHGPTTADLTGLSSGTYTVTVTDTNGCQRAVTINLADAATNTLTGTVFEDFNSNGILDGGDTGPAGVTVRLYDDNNQDGLVDGGDTQIQTTATIAGGGYSFPIQNDYSTSYDGQVSIGSDDAKDGFNNIANLKLSADWIGIRFQNINIPAGATITSSYLELVSKGNKTTSPANVSIRAHDIANPLTFASSGTDVSGRTGTTANVTWNFGNWNKDVTYQSPDLTSVIQELYTDYSPYTLGNIALLLEPTGSQNRDAYSYESSTIQMPRLVINYTISGTYYHVVDVDVSTLPVGYTLTTDNVEAASFTASGQTDTGNDFGYKTTTLIADAGLPASICAGDNTTLTASETGGTPVVTYAWDNGLGAGISQVVSPASTTKYKVTATDSNGYTSVDSVTITVNALPTATATSDGPKCEGDNLLLDETGGDAVAWNWSGPSGASSNSKSFGLGGVDPSNAGIYSVTITDTNGCTAVSTVNVTIYAEPTATAGSNSAICVGEDLNLTESGGDAVSWSWDGPNTFTSTAQNPTINTATIAADGNYNVTITDGNGCTAVSSTSVTVNPGATATAGSNSSICAGEDLNLTESGGDAVSWSWTGPNTFTSTSQNPTISAATVAADGNYNVTITDGNGCTAVSSTSVTVNLVATATAGSNSAICAGEDLNLTESGGGAVSWSWTGPNTFTSTSQNPTISSATVAAAGNYNVTITDGNGCTAVSSISVTVNAAATAIAGSNSAICAGEDLNLTESGGSALSWSWTGPNTFTSTSQNPTISAATIVAAGNYNVTITDGNGCTAVSSTSVTINPGATATAGSNSAICAGEDLNLTESGGDAVSWSWTGPNTFTSTSQNPTISSATVAADGNYNVTITDGSGCTAVSSTSVTVNPAATATAGSNSSICAGEDLNLTESGGDAVSWSWTGPNTFTSTAQNPTISSATVAADGNYNVTITDGNGCTGTSSVNVTVNETIVSLTLADNEECVNNTILTLSGGTPVGGTYSGTGVSGGNFNASAAGLGVHTITYTFTDINGCTYFDTDNITVISLPAVTLTLTNDQECVTSNTLALGGGNPIGGSFSGLGVTGSNFDASAAGAGVHTVTYTYTDANGCSNTATDDIVVFDLPTVGLTLPDTEDCVLNSAFALNGESPVGGIFSGPGVSGTNFDASAVGLGTHTITYTFTDVNGCTNTATDQIDVVTGPTAGLTLVNNEECETSTALALSGGSPAGGTYSGTGVSGTNFDASLAGPGAHVITYTYTDVNGCADSANDNITVYAEPNITNVTSVDPSTCGGSDGSITVTAAGGTGSYEYRINSGSWQAGNVFSGLTIGSYNVEIRNDNGYCVIAYTSNPVVLSDPPSFTAEINLPTADCVGNAVNFNATDVGGPASYFWNFGAGASPVATVGLGPHPVTYATGGAKTVTLTITKAGCVEVDSETYTPFDLPIVSLSLPDTEECEDYTILALSGGTPLGGSFSGPGVTGSNFDASVAGVGTHTITYSYTDGNGCVNTATDDIDVLALPTVSLTLGTDEACFTGNTLLLTGGVPGGGTYSGTAVTGTNFDASVAGAGTHTITYTYTDGNGCINTATDDITVYGYPTIDNVTGADPSSCGGTEGTITITASGGTGSFEYRLDSGSWQSSNTFTGLSIGSYDVYVRYDNGLCEVAYAGNSVVLNDPPAISVSTLVTSNYLGEDITCVGASDGTVQATGSGGVAPYTYLWSNGQTGADLLNVAAGTYSVTATDAASCQAATTITLNDPPPLGATAVFTDVSCFGGSDGAIDVTATGGVGAYTYAWNDLEPEAFWAFDGSTDDITGNGHHARAVYNNELYSNDAVDGDQSFNFDGGSAIYYDDDVAFMESVFTERTVLMWIKPTNLWGTEMLYDEGSNTHGIGLRISNNRLQGAVRSFSNQSTAFEMTIPNDGAWHQVGFVYDNGDFTLVVDGVMGTTSVTGFVQIQMLAPPWNICGVGAKLGSDAFGGTTWGNPRFYRGLMDNVAYYDKALTAQQIIDNNTDDGDRSNLPAGDYLVYVYDLNGCVDSVTLTLGQPDSIVLAFNNTDISCFGANDGAIDMTITGGTAPYTQLWSNTATTEDINSLAPGIYSVTITDANGCTQVSSTAISEPAVLTASASPISNYTGFNISCTGASDGNAQATPSGGTSPYYYLWDNGQTNANLINVGVGSYDVTVTDNNGCTTTANVSLTEPLVISVSTSISSSYGGEDISCVGATDGSASATASNGVGSYTYLWSNGQFGANLTNVGAGTYTVFVSDGNGCVATGTVTLVDPPAITMTATVTSNYNGANVTCAGAADANALANASGGIGAFTYNWSNGQTGPNLVNVSSGSYTVTATDAFGCTTVETVTVVNPTDVTATITSTSDFNGYGLSCEGGNDGSATVTAGGGVGAYTYNWSNGDTGTTLSNVGPGTYTVTVSDANGCTETTSTTFTEPPSMSVSVTSADPSDCGVNDGIILVTASGGVGGSFEYSIDGFTWQPLNFFVGLGPGTYFVYVRNSFGTCPVGPIATVINLPETPTIDNITVINPTTAISTDGGVLVDASGSGIAIEYRLNGVTGWQLSNLFNGLTVGTYTLEIKYVGQTCISTAIVNLVAGGGVVGTGGGVNYCSDDLSGVSFVETYYIPYPEDQVLSSLSLLSASSCGFFEAVDPIQTYVSIGVVESGTIIHYDHWEDGYEPNLSFPIQSTTEIWGDGNAANGIPPGYAIDILDASDIIILNNAVTSTTRAAIIDFDAGDKIGGRGNLSITRLAWASATSTLLAGAFEVYPSSEWGTDYVIPVGENTDVNNMFEYTGITIMAQSNNTTVNIDVDADGSDDVTTVLNEGESYLVHGGAFSGGTISADNPVQVGLVTGDVCAGHESRFITLKPQDQWSDAYYNPVSTLNDGSGSTNSNNYPTYVHLFNPSSSSSIQVFWETNAGVQGSTSIGPGNTDFIEIPEDTGSRFYTTNGAIFYAVATIDSDPNGGRRNDWGFALVPESSVSPQITLVGFAPGDDPTYTGGSPENSAPVWLTAAYPQGSGSSGSITLCVDYNGDGGSLTDGNGIDYDVSWALNELDQLKVYDPDGDQTGMQIWVCDGSDAVIAGAWGQDPATASGGSPAIDMGVGLPNGIPFATAKCVDLSKDYNSNGLYDECDEVIYTIEIRNTGALPLSTGSLNVTDSLPFPLTYISGTLQSIISGVVNNIPDDAGPATPFPLDESGFSYNSVIQPGDSIILRFEALIGDLPSSQFITNIANVTNGGQILYPEVSFPAQEPTGPILFGVPADKMVACTDVPAAPIIGSEIYVTNNCEELTPVDQSGWSLQYVDSEELVSETAPATNVFDGDINTIWSTQYNGGSPVHPHEIQIDLGATYTIGGFRALPRQTGTNGIIRSFEFYISSDGVSWGTAITSGNWGSGNTENEEFFNLRQGRFVRLVALSEVAGNPWTSLAELNVLQCVNYAAATTSFSEVNTQTSNGSSTDDCYDITRTWESTDHCGQLSTYTQVLTVVDTVDPVLVNIPVDLVTSIDLIPNPPVLDCSNPGNLATGKTVSQSSTAVGGDASNAIDGNNDGDFSNGSVTLTNSELEPWWEIDLATSEYIQDINLWNRTDCCAANLSNYYILLSDQPFGTDPLATLLLSPDVTSYFQIAQAGSPSLIPINNKARYIRIQLQGTTTLSLTEVEIIPQCIYATDNCDTDVTVTMTEVNIPSGCAYTITRTWAATDNCGNTSTTSQVISVSSTLSLSANTTSDYNGNDVSCNGSSDGAAEVIVNGGVPPISLNWSNGQTGSTTINLSAGVYYVTVTDGNGCTAADSVAVSEPSLITTNTSITSNHNGEHISCVGSTDGSAFLTHAGGTAPKTILWSNGQSTASATGLGAGTYYVTITDNNACTTLDSVTLVDPTPLSVTASITSNFNGEDISCTGANDGTAEAVGAGGVAPLSYQWSNSQLGTSATGLVATSYTVTVTDANNCTATDMVTFTDPPVIVLNVGLITEPSLCGATDGIITLSATGGTNNYEYRLGAAGGWQSGNTFSGLSSGTYDFFVRNDDSSCPSAALQATLTDPIPAACSITPPDTTFTVCATDVSVKFFVSPLPDASGYTWTVPAPAVIVSGQGTDTILVNMNNITLGTYNICVVTNSACGDSPSCCLAMDVVTCNEICNNGIDDDGDGLFDCDDPDCGYASNINLTASTCVGDAVSLTTDTTLVGATYTWDFGADATPATASGVGPHSVTYGASGLKYVSVDILLNSCPLLLLDSITVNNCTAALGDFVWQDDNEDGIQDGGEIGIEGVTVSLYDNTDALVNTTTTAADGSFLFNGVTLGTYYMVFDVSTNVGGITAFKGTLQNVGSPLTDSDANPATGRTQMFLFNPSLGNILTVDAGFILSCSPSQRGGVNVIRK